MSKLFVLALFSQENSRDISTLHVHQTNSAEQPILQKEKRPKKNPPKLKKKNDFSRLINHQI
jgi:hypothetical protein